MRRATVRERGERLKSYRHVPSHQIFEAVIPFLLASYSSFHYYLPNLLEEYSLKQLLFCLLCFDTSGEQVTDSSKCTHIATVIRLLASSVSHDRITPKKVEMVHFNMYLCILTFEKR